MNHYKLKDMKIKVQLVALILFALNLGTYAQEKVAELNFVNSCSSAIDFKVKMIEIDVSDSINSHYFCWDVCYQTGVLVSPGYVGVVAGDSTSQFSSHVNMNSGDTAISQIAYCFFNKAVGQSDSVCVIFGFDQNTDTTHTTVIFDVCATGVEALLNSNKIEVYPNPAVETLIFNGVKVQCKVVIYDMLGQAVVTGLIGISNELDISFLMEGTYMYQVISENGNVLKKVRKNLKN